MVNLYKVLKNSYEDKNKQSKAFQNKGYKFDSDLSNDNQQVYFNPKKKKLLYSVSGTHNLSDVGTDAYLLAGKLKDTNRYKEAQNTLEKAKKKYSPSETTVAGHSLGGSISQYIASKKDKVYTLDKGATFGQKTRSNEKAFRQSGDIVSALNANSTRMTTLNRPKSIIEATGKLIGQYVNPIGSILDSHDVDKIKKSKIKI